MSSVSRNLFLITLIFIAACGIRFPPSAPVSPKEPVAESPIAIGPPSTPQSAATEAAEERLTAPEPASQAAPATKIPESLVGAPEIDRVSAALRYDTVVMLRSSDVVTAAGWEFRKNKQEQIVGFEFSNRGGNRILPQRYDIARNLLFTRDFQFRFDGRARQDIHLTVTDWAPAANRQFKLSDLMNSVLLFFPRHYLPAITSSGGRYAVTLPTGEQVEFDAESREIVSGVLAEQPVDLSPNRAMRKFPAVHYTGKGISVRANARGDDPRIATTATITDGSAGDCGGTPCKQCRVPARELWQQTGAVRFKFATDAEFDRYLRVRCGFGLPILEANLASFPSRSSSDM